MDKRIGAQFYTIRDFCQTLEDFDSSCKRVSEMGYKLIQLSGVGNFEAKDIKNILDKYGLGVVCTHRPAQNYIDNLEGEIEFHKTIGTKICGIGAIPAFNVKKETIDKFTEDFKTVVEELKKHGLVFGYHNHALEFEKVDGKYVLDNIIEKIDNDNFKFILDVHWVARAGINPAKFIKKYSDKIACVHFKDFKIVENEPLFAKVGEGNLDWDEIIDACENSDAEFALVEQDTCDCDPFDCLKASYDFLSKKGFE